MTVSLFKNAIKPKVGNTWQTLCEAPAGKSSLVLQINGSVSGEADLIGSARVFDASAGVYSYLIKDAPIPQGDAIRLVDQAKIVLETGDRVEVKCESPDGTIDFIGSLIQDINDQSYGISFGTYKNSIITDVGNDWSAVYEAPSGKDSFVLQINVANKSDSGVQVSVRLFDASVPAPAPGDEDLRYVTVLDGAPVPIADAIRLIDHAKIVLEAGDRLEVKCATVDEKVDLVTSLIEDVNQG